MGGPLRCPQTETSVLALLFDAFDRHRTAVVEQSAEEILAGPVSAPALTLLRAGRALHELIGAIRRCPRQPIRLTPSLFSSTKRRLAGLTAILHLEMARIGVHAGQKCQQGIDDQEAGVVFFNQPAEQGDIARNMHLPCALTSVDLAQMEDALGIGAGRNQPRPDGLLGVVFRIEDDDAAARPLCAVGHNTGAADARGQIEEQS